MGLEEFLYLLNGELEKPAVTINADNLQFPKIQSGQTITQALVISNETRGYVEGNFSLSKPLPGVTLIPEDFSINSSSGSNAFSINLQIDSTQLLKGLLYESTIIIDTSSEQRIEIPLSFKIVFPKTAFIREVAKYSVIASVFFLLIRLLIALRFPDWLGKSFDYFISWDIASSNPGNFTIFGLTFFAFTTVLFLILFYLIKFLKK